VDSEIFKLTTRRSWSKIIFMMTDISSEQIVAAPPETDRKTPLYGNHVARGAKIVDFAGWQMPLQFGKVMEEHHSVRAAAGLFDISHMGLVVLRSGDPDVTRAFLDRLVPQNLSKLYPGKAVYTQFLNERGGIIDDVIIYWMPESEHLSGFQEFLVICNAGNIAKDMAWMRQQADAVQCRDLSIELLSDRYCLLALQGPRFADVLARTGFNTDHLPKRFHIGEALIQGTPVWLSRTGYTGEDGVEIIVPVAQTEFLWNLLLDLGRPNGLKPIGLAARDTLRLEAAYPLHGHDITENETPLEAGLGWSVKLEKPGDFIGKSALLAQQERGLEKEFYCFTINKRTIAREHDVILKNGTPVGQVTSGSISPLFNVPIGMGYIASHAVSGPGDIVQIRVRGVDVDAEIVERPFYQK
jgi:aminomethyltransferase